MLGDVPQFLEAMDRIMADSGSTHEAAAAGQMSLFGGVFGSGGMAMNADLLKAAQELKATEHKQMLEWEKEALGVHVSEHPLERPLAMLSTRTNATIGEIEKHMNGKTIRVAGMISPLRTLTTKKGDPMAFGTLEDLDDKIDLVFFPRTWEQHRQQVEVDQVMLVVGKVQVKDDHVNIIVDRVVTKLETAQAADLPDDVISPPPVKSNGSGQRLAQGEPARTPPQAAVSAPQSVPDNDPSQGPPPPPNWDDGELQAVEPIKKGALEQPAQTVQRSTPLLETAKPAAAAETYIARSGEVKEVPGRGNHRASMIVVEIKAAGNWQETCRHTVKTAKSFPGKDSLKIRFPGQTLTMTLPEGSTDFCDDLIESLEKIPGIIRVYGS